jgi:UV DNA damage endonuclease
MAVVKIGYPCINRSITASSSKSFRLKSFTEERFRSTVESNLHGLQEILEYNKVHKLLFLRISSDLIPFASHPICTVPWQKLYAKEFASIGAFIKKNDMRISMHPDQFVLLNSPGEQIFQNSIAELQYHADILDLLDLDTTAKIQIHVGGAYGEKGKSIDRFIKRYGSLPESIKKRLAIENDDRLFSIKDCLTIYSYTGIPIIFDTLHHEILNDNESLRDALQLCGNTWKTEDGIPMIDYSQQEPGVRTGNHIQHIETDQFRHFLTMSKGLDFDIMLEIKDKEKSALEAVNYLN